jgi:ATP-dependent exoDNAse (exonuclease V) beta subunit
VFAEGLDGRPAWTAWDHRRFAQLVEIAHAFDEAAGLRPSELVEHVRLTRVEDPTAAQVRVMTIHKSKGLEFDAVVLPELGGKLDFRPPIVLTGRPDPFGAIVSVSRSGNQELRALNEELKDLAAEAKGREFGEILSVLYVAMTRAARRLEMIVPEKVDGACRYATILREALGAGEADEDGRLWRHPDADEDWTRGLEERAAVDSSAPIEDLRLRETQAPRTLPSRSPSAEEGGGATRAAELLRAPSRAATTRGLLVHRWLEELEWIEDFDATDEELLAIGAALEPELGRRREALADLRRALECPEVRAILTRPASGSFEVWPERAFSLVLPDESGAEQLWNGAIDRLVLELADGEVVGAEVLDYKSDRIGEAGLADRTGFYLPQLRSYRRVAAALTGLDESRIRTRLLFLVPGRLVDVEE